MNEKERQYPTQYMPKIQEFFLTELLLEGYMSHSEIIGISKKLGYEVENHFRQMLRKKQTDTLIGIVGIGVIVFMGVLVILFHE